MKDKNAIGAREISIPAAGCVLSVPIIIAAGFRYALKFAQGKEHQFSHEVEEVELEGEKAALLEEGVPIKDLVQRFSKKIERVTEQYSKMGGRFSATEFQNQKTRLESLKKRLETDESDAECKNLLVDAERRLQQYAPQ